MSGFSVELLGGVTNVGGFGASRGQEIRTPQEGLGQAQGTEQGQGKGGPTFADMLNDKLSEANNLIQDANVAAEELIAGRSKDIHGAMISLEKADVSFRMLMQVRNKMIDAYREIMRMQV